MRSGFWIRTAIILPYGHNANKVAVVGDFNGWKNSFPCTVRLDQSGIWEGFIPHIQAGENTSFTSRDIKLWS